MGHESERIEEDFPGKAERIETLADTNPHFARLIETYRSLNRDVHRIEITHDPEADEEWEELKRRRLLVKDEIAAMIAAGEQ